MKAHLLANRLPRFLPLAAASTAILVAGCSGGGSHGHHHEPPSPPVFVEIEPNDHPFDADFIGPVDDRSHFFVDGYVESIPGWDLFDYFEFVAEEPCQIEFYLEGYAPFADVDIAIFDPEYGEFLAYFDSPWNPEYGWFTVHEYGKVFQLVVDAHLVDTDYTLEIIGHGYSISPSTDGSQTSAAEAVPSSGIAFPDGPHPPQKAKHGGPGAEEIAERNQAAVEGFLPPGEAIALVPAESLAARRDEDVLGDR